MNEKPMLFSGPMVEAILDGRKTQTRRMNKLNGVNKYPGDWKLKQLTREFIARFHNLFDDHNKDLVYCPFGSIGDRLWVREAFCPDWSDDIIYRADGGSAKEAGYPKEPKWKPSIHMKRTQSRINLEITDIRVERLQDISKKDIYAEGVILKNRPDEFSKDSVLSVDGMSYLSWATAWISLWNSINEKRGLGWDKNPWVWALTFKKL